MPIVSIIVPTLNEEKFIKRTLKALNNQSVSRELYEIIVSDSSSDDSTVKIAKGLCDTVVMCKREGASNGRNCGAKLAKGKFLGFVDADTLVGDKWVEGLISCLSKKEFVACTGPIEPLEKGSKKFSLFFKFWDMQTKLSLLLGVPLLPGFSFGVRRDIFEIEKGFLVHDTGEDFELSMRLRKRGQIGYSEKMLAKSSTRRLKEISAIDYFMNGVHILAEGKGWSWEKHRKDFKRKIKHKKVVVN